MKKATGKKPADRGSDAKSTKTQPAKVGCVPNANAGKPLCAKPKQRLTRNDLCSYSYQKNELTLFFNKDFPRGWLYSAIPVVYF